MRIWRNFEQETHELIDIHNLQTVHAVPCFEVRTPGKPDGLHHVGEQVVQLHLVLLPRSQLLGLVLLSTWDNEGRMRVGNEAADAKVVVEWRQHLGTVSVDHDLEARLGNQENILSPGETIVVEKVWYFIILQRRNLEINISNISSDSHHVSNTKLVTSWEPSHDITSLR